MVLGSRLFSSVEVFKEFNLIQFENPIPVELTAFTANVIGSDVILNWETATETNNSGFDIERSEDNINFAHIGFVPGSGTTTEIRNYSYTDNLVSGGTYYYRLKQID